MDTPMYEQQEQQGFFSKNKNVFKGLFIAFLILVLLIPTFFIGNLIEERKGRNEEVKTEIASQWSRPQTVCGPILVIPYITSVKESNGKIETVKNNAYFMPDKLNLNTSLLPEIKSRSIFKVPVYNSTIAMQGTFAPLDANTLNIAPENFVFNEAKLVVSITDFKGLQEQTKINWDNASADFSIGDHYGVICNAEKPVNQYAISVDESRDNVYTTSQALSAKVVIDANTIKQAHTFNMKLALRGTEKIFFTPIGTTTKVDIQSNWSDRDFKGNYLPETHTLTDTGFKASWSIYRSILPQQKNTLSNLDRTTFGVNLIQPLDNYAKTTRTIKYAVLVIMLTFVVYFFIEIFQKRYVHAFQYILIGFALCMFYTLLLSISEYLSFQQAYYIAACSTIVLIGLYTKSIFDSYKTAGIFSGFLFLLYAFIFVLIQLQDGALLVGSIGLFLILAAIMYISRKVAWNAK